MTFPFNAEGLVDGESAPAEPSTADLAEEGHFDVDDAGVEVAPALSPDALDAVDALARRRHEQRDPDA